MFVGINGEVATDQFSDGHDARPEIVAADGINGEEVAREIDVARIPCLDSNSYRYSRARRLCVPKT
jgi:hypothetical protein